VLDAHRSVIAAMAPGVSWPDMHTLAYRKILGGLAAGGLLQVCWLHLYPLDCCVLVHSTGRNLLQVFIRGLGLLLWQCWMRTTA
jgi:hypothetical protein